MTTYVLETDHRTVTLRIEEQPDRVLCSVRLSRFGDAPDLPDMLLWMHGLLVGYEGNGKPLVMDFPQRGLRGSATDEGTLVTTRLSS